MSMGTMPLDSRCHVRGRAVKIGRGPHQNDSGEVHETRLVGSDHRLERSIVLLGSKGVDASVVRPQLGDVAECLVFPSAVVESYNCSPRREPVKYTSEVATSP